MIRKLSVLKVGSEENFSDWFVSTIKKVKYWVKYGGLEFDVLHLRTEGITSEQLNYFSDLVMSFFEEAQKTAFMYSKGKYQLSQEWIVAPTKNNKKGVFIVGFKIK